MAGFCTQCGRPLPESGVCSCAAQQPVPQPIPQQAPQQPYPQQPYGQPYQQPYPQQPYGQPYQQPYRPKNPNGFGASISKIPAMITEYCKDSVGTSRRMLKEANPNHGLVFMLLSLVLTAFGTLLFGLIYGDEPLFGLFRLQSDGFVVRWLLTSIFAPALAYGLSIGLIYALNAISKVTADIRGVVSAVGVSATLPCMLLALSSILSLADSSGKLFAALALIIFAAWIVSLLITALRSFEVKLNALSIGVTILTVYLSIIVMRTFYLWLLTGEFEVYLYMVGL